MKIAAYIRVSTDRQVDHGDSIDNQLKLADQWCEKKGYELAHIYDEGGASAYRDKRRVFKEMLLDIKAATNAAITDSHHLGLVSAPPRAWDQPVPSERPKEDDQTPRNPRPPGKTNNMSQSENCCQQLRSDPKH